ncbi:cytochrome P450 [Cercophora newfieldiana]|uniref:Cytochrome P450 n=1 Tax=Cercophora newfieldiana TaxID=92897 RepID=A0AA39XTQ9_9PEZI|nr:cytochrome P450 [Cercophora newfieldiana]
MSRSTALVDLFSNKLSVVLPTIAVLLGALFVRALFAADPLSHIPEVGRELGSNEKRRQAFLANAKALYRDGYQKFKDGVFQIVTSKANTSVVVVAPRYLDELKKLPDSIISMEDAVAQSLHAKYTKLPVGDNTVAHTIKSSLNPALPHLNQELLDEVEQSFLAELPPCDDWTPIRFHGKLLRIVARVSGRVFVGPELGRDEGYLDAAINYTVEVMNARRAIDRMQPWKRPFLAWRLPEVKRLDERFRQATAILRPIVEARMRLGPDERPNDMLQWLMDDSQAKFGKQSSARLAQMQLALSFASIHTTTMTGTNALYDLAAHPELATELRQEIVSVLAANNGIMSTHALQAMKKLDSFLKESLRLHPPGASSFQRKVRQPITLSTGENIPAGVVIEAAAHAVTRDPRIFDDPEEFRPLRFYEMRQRYREEGSVDQAARNQFVSVSSNALSFGYGRHACPGRFFAANEIKLIVATCILLYDVRLAGGATERYKNFEFGTSSIPDPSKELVFRRVAG